MLVKKLSLWHNKQQAPPVVGTCCVKISATVRAFANWLGLVFFCSVSTCYWSGGCMTKRTKPCYSLSIRCTSPCRCFLISLRRSRWCRLILTSLPLWHDWIDKVREVLRAQSILMIIKNTLEITFAIPLYCTLQVTDMRYFLLTGYPLM